MKRLLALALFISLAFFSPDHVFALSQDSLSVQPADEEMALDSSRDQQLEETPASIVDESNRIVPRNEKFDFSLFKILRGILGMVVLILIAWVFSTNRKAINWQVVLVGISIQLVLAIGILWVPPVQIFFEIVGKLFVKVLDFTYAGTDFLFRSNRLGEIEPPLLNFAITILPTIIFFAALTSVLFYFGIIQKVVYGLAWALSKALKLSGAESPILRNALRAVGRSEEAAASFREAIRIEPAYVEAHVHLGNLLNDLRRYDEAISCYENALAADAEHIVALFNLSGVVYPAAGSIIRKKRWGRGRTRPHCL